MRLPRTFPGLLVAAALWGCGPSATSGGFDSANPAARMYAIEQAAREGDQSAIRDLIEQLDSDDPAVRMLAISTLERLTGETYGYRQYDSETQRRQAIARWVAAENAGEIHPANASTAADSPATSHDQTQIADPADDHG